MKRIKKFLPEGAAFFIVFLLMFALYRIYGYAPWGNRSLATDDGYWQYMDFFGWYQDVLFGKQSLSYSFSNGLGMPGLALFMYYLSSPWNLLIVFFSKDSFHTFFDLIVALKLATAGSTACFFLRKRFDDRVDVRLAVLLAISYALMEYDFSKAACTMWLDGVYMLPIIMLGVHKLMKEKKPLLLSLSVALAILFNWYSAGMDCMFSILWFVVELVLVIGETNGEQGKGKFWKEAFFALIRYGVAMTLGVLLTACLFIPMLYQMLKATRGSADWALFKNDFLGNIFNVIPNYAIGVASWRGTLCLFCGGLVLIGCMGFFISKQISRKWKWAVGAGLFVTILCCYWQPLYLIASLFQDASSYYYRMSYVSCAIMMFMAGAFFASDHSEETAAWIWKVSLGYILLLFAADYFVSYTEDRFLYATAALHATIVILYLLATRLREKEAAYAWLTILLCAVTLFEMAYNAQLLMDRYSSNTDVEAFHSYQNEQIALIERLQAADSTPYRITQTAARAGAINQIANLNESMGFGYWAIENYNSMPTATQIRFLEKSGYAVYLDRIVAKAMSILPIDSLLGVKYILSPYPYETLTLREEFGSSNGKQVYQNPYVMPMAFKIGASQSFYADFGNNTYLWQNALFRYISGQDRDVFIPAEYSVSEENGIRTYTFDIPEGRYALYGNILWFTESAWSRDRGSLIDLNGRLEINYSAINSESNFYIPISEGDTVAYITQQSDDFGAFQEPQFYLADLDYLYEISETARENGPADLMVEDGHLQCTVTANEGEQLFTSVPFVKGWTVKRNGEKISPNNVDECLMVIPLVEGENRIEMVYHTPYVLPGVILSVLAVICLIIWCRKIRTLSNKTKG